MKENKLAKGIFGIRSFLFDNRDMGRRYEILEELSESFGTGVFKAYDRKRDSFVAIKRTSFNSPHVLSNRAGFIARWKRMCKYGGMKFRHRNIISIKKHGIDYRQGFLFYTTRYVSGYSLSDVRKIEALGIKKKMRIALQIAQALSFAHDKGVIHRDIKPSNILVDFQEVPYLIDFGAAKFESLPITKSGYTFGTPEHMSPEQIKGEELDNRSDMFSLGNVFYFFFTGQNPFTGKNSYEISKNIVEFVPSAPRKVNGEIPERLSNLIEKMLSKDRDKRFYKMGEIVEELKQLLDNYSI